MGWNLDPDRLDALQRIGRALKEARAAKKRGFNVQQVKDILKQATNAWTANDYDTAADLADRAMEMLGLPPLP